MRFPELSGLTQGNGPGYDPRSGSDRRSTSSKGANRKGAFSAVAMRKEHVAVAALLLAILVTRSVRLDQPIVENYVGRQIPTAMVARNLDRGSGFLHPQLDIAPFPNQFLVEPPIYAATVVLVRRLTLLKLEACGRLVSAVATAFGAWGLFGLVRRREGPTIALVAVAAFGLFPITIRYGRAFQPDAMMLGVLLAGLHCWDEHEHGRGAGWLVIGWALIALGLTLKIISAYILVPLHLVIVRPPRSRTRALALGTLLPALLWYTHAWRELRAPSGSLASADNATLWMHALIPDAIFKPAFYSLMARFLFIRAFTPIGFLLLILGLWPTRRPIDRFWQVWAFAAVLYLVVLAGKAHHEYYWLALAPCGAVGVGCALGMMADAGKWGLRGAWLTGMTFTGMAVCLSASTWRTPGEWQHLSRAARAIEDIVPPNALIVAPEALIYGADRRGCRLEVTPSSVRRAAGEWNVTLERNEPIDLLEFYRSRGATFFADLEPEPPSAIEPQRRALHEAVRSRYKVLVDRPGVLIAELWGERGAVDAD
jgi:hypothetical protein